MRIFLSHSGRDKPLAREIRDHFPPWLRTWIDEDRLLFGTELAPSLKDAIDSEVDYVVLLFGRDAADSSWVEREISWALEREEQLGRTFVLPVLLDDSRDRLAALGLAGRLALEMADFTSASTELVADRLVNHLGGWMSEQLAITPTHVRAAPPVFDSLRKLSEAVLAIVDDIPEPWRPTVESVLVRPFVHDLAASRVGIIPLTPAQYYKRILTDMARADSAARISAVSTLSSELWNYDADQTRYAARNLEAVGRGARIQRLFVLPQMQALAFADEIRRQDEAGIEVRVASTSLLAHVPDLEDFVLFDTGGGGARAYVSQPSIDGSRRIRSGTLLIADHALARLRTSLHDAWDLASAPADFVRTLQTSATQTGARRAPGLDLHRHHLDSPVITCEDAASARRIPLAHELKTLLLKTSHGMVAAHLPGDGVLS